MELLSIILSIIGALGTIVGILGISAFFQERAKHKAQKKNKQDDEAEAAEQEKQAKFFKDVLSSELAPIKKSLEDVKHDLKQNKEGTITSLRSLMKRLRDQYMAQGYADSGDKATWHELYHNYANMGGNHFKEWVDGWKRDVDNLPDHKEK